MLIRIRKHLLSKKAQSTAEYAVLFGLVVGAVITMQVYVKRSLQAKVRDASKLMTDQGGSGVGVGGTSSATLGTTEQYEPYYLYREQQQTASRDRTEKSVESGEATTDIGKSVTTESLVQYKAYENVTATPP